MLGCSKICDYLLQHKVGAIRLELGTWNLEDMSVEHQCFKNRFVWKDFFRLDTSANRKTFVWKAKLSNLQHQFGMSVFELRVEEGKLEEGLDAKAGVLTNFEVLNILRLRGEASDPLGKVFDYLVLSAACNNKRECISEFLKRTEKYNLTNAEKLNIINVRPTVELQSTR
ncbi:hypothetical protein AAC387_Pa09g0445 [Persea americana]